MRVDRRRDRWGQVGTGGLGWQGDTCTSVHLCTCTHTHTHLQTRNHMKQQDMGTVDNNQLTVGFSVTELKPFVNSDAIRSLSGTLAADLGVDKTFPLSISSCCRLSHNTFVSLA